MPFCQIRIIAEKPKPYASSPRHLGEHIKKRRFELALRQRDVALRLKITSFTLINWERGQTEPPVKYWPRIMDFLGYCPYQRARTLGDHLRLHRTHRGLSHRELAKLIRVDAGSLSRWETGERRPTRVSKVVLEKFLREGAGRTKT